MNGKIKDLSRDMQTYTHNDQLCFHKLITSYFKNVINKISIYKKSNSYLSSHTVQTYFYIIFVFLYIFCKDSETGDTLKCITTTKTRLYNMTLLNPEAVPTSAHNLCFEQKYEKYQNFLSEIFSFFFDLLNFQYI